MIEILEIETNDEFFRELGERFKENMRELSVVIKIVNNEFFCEL